ncbi:sigma-70 family RNA polymerase sigma factor [candidate division KSB1 bacterium]|nr:sigma-70 family RNA polymerase sigma factor [candidate division KSB1 bacterium]NIR68478.1 sigma-70 family RNA polymerase sigma factor [candidate division KSB1 bacterium]NIS22492.1 sigma-70 family RNA polymerase sigma factor [candidate division KSB1 bacterium]NIT69336.1 sigma-70 family RNA polymerase sigma factor [candidate division KSB1 bacterium]NIU22997.1 sigma-70 family RNA polymerase sigma factor [candidate division KSB1 bacterium]
MQNQQHQALRRKFKEIAFQHVDGLYNLAFHLSNNRWDAEDLVQETYLKAYLSFENFEEGSNFRGWIYTILYHSFINHYRKKSRMPLRIDFDYLKDTCPDDRNSRKFSLFTDDYERHLADEVLLAMEKLPEHYKVPVILADLFDMKYKEVASALKCPIGTVMSRIARARQKLRNSLRKYAREYGYV